MIRKVEFRTASSPVLVLELYQWSLANDGVVMLI